MFTRTNVKRVLIVAFFAIQLSAFSQVIKEKVVSNEHFASILQYSDNELIYVGTKQNPDNRHHDKLHQGIDDCAKRGGHHKRDGQADDVALERKFLELIDEFLHIPLLLFPSCSTSGI